MVRAQGRLVERLESSESLFGPKARTLSKLRELSKETEAEGWDGYGAQPMNRSARFHAESFIRALPPDAATPELTVDPDGSVAFDWIASPNRMFSISFGPRPRLAYSRMDGTDYKHGVASFDGARIPERILEELRRVLAS